MTNEKTTKQLFVSQALRRIKKVKGRMAELTSRAAGVVSFESSKKPHFDFIALRDELKLVREELVTLEAAVARANATTVIEADDRKMSVAEAIRRLQETKAEIVWLASLSLREGTEEHPTLDWCETTGRQVRKVNAVTYVAKLSEVDRVAEVDRLKEQFERINDAVERANHTTRVVWEEPQA